MTLTKSRNLQPFGGGTGGHLLLTKIKGKKLAQLFGSMMFRIWNLRSEFDNAIFHACHTSTRIIGGFAFLAWRQNGIGVDGTFTGISCNLILINFY